MELRVITENKGRQMNDLVREYVRECLSEGVKVTGGGHTFRAKPGSQVSFTDATSGKPVSGTFKKRVTRGGHQYAHVETGKAAHYVPVHQMHGAKKIDEESLDEISDPAKKRYVKAAARDLKNIGLTQGAHSQANPRPNAPKGSHDEFTKTNLRMMKNREKGIERALKEDDMMQKKDKKPSGYGHASDAHYAAQSPKMQTAINLHLRKGKSYDDAVSAAKKHVKE